MIVLDGGKILFNGSLVSVSDKLTFGLSRSAPLTSDVLYSGASELGYAYIKTNPFHDPGNVDIETLFNGLTEAPERLISLLNPSSHG